MSAPLLIHATAVAIETALGPRAVLLRGPSGAGKSDLGLRLIDAGAQLVADDQAELHRQGGAVIVRAPAAIAGLIEVRGIGIIRMKALPEAALALIADLVRPEAIERLPNRATERILDVEIPCVALAPFEASAVAKARLILRGLTGPGLPALIET